MDHLVKLCVGGWVIRSQISAWGKPRPGLVLDTVRDTPLGETTAWAGVRVIRYVTHPFNPLFMTPATATNMGAAAVAYISGIQTTLDTESSVVGNRRYQ